MRRNKVHEIWIFSFWQGGGPTCHDTTPRGTLFSALYWSAARSAPDKRLLGVHPIGRTTYVLEVSGEGFVSEKERKKKVIKKVVVFVFEGTMVLASLEDVRTVLKEQGH
ncbi:hypothetical protein AVEN_92712-1 [Araneus ventricosus]|uniref:Uncharacterized protein n=1 Tax=Araneus ventricosus TaxID=182803 RepID=A0A4Y2M013_ARAVE|nr:hypothetical protein AVEN_97792-1 [Araneus ventricosus]GBN20368.1 hypothetical protein AVEN_92712-1 [Araneus ventricosus]